MTNAGDSLLQQNLIKGVWVLAGLSLGINSFLVKEKVAEIAETLKTLTVASHTLQVNQAVLKRDIDVYGDRLSRLESLTSEMRTRYYAKPNR